MDNLSTGEKIAGIAGVALLLIMFIFDWFSLDAAGFDLGGGNAWEVFSLIDIILFVTSIAAIGLAVSAATSSQVNTPVALSAITAGLGILATLLVLYRIIDPPGSGDAEEAGVEIGRSIGVWLGFIAAAAVAYGGWRSMEEEGTSFGQQADRLGGDEPPPPPPSGPAA
jgi:hypothetical protein